MKRLALVPILSLCAACSSQDGPYPLPEAKTSASNDQPAAVWVHYCEWMQRCAPAPFTATYPDTYACARSVAAGASSDCAAAVTDCPPETKTVPNVCAASDAATPDASDAATPDASDAATPGASDAAAPDAAGDH